MPASPARQTHVTHLLYLHGFRSSPQSAKARKVAGWMREHRPDVTWWCPQLPPSPAAAMKMISQGTASWPHASMGVMGSSLGGFYATCVAERTGCRAVLLNPAVYPARDLFKYIGEQTSWHDAGERFFFQPGFVDELRAMETPAITYPERYFAVIAQGDEVLDWREMTGRYPGAQIKLLEGSDHALSGFADDMGAALAFLGLA